MRIEMELRLGGIWPAGAIPHLRQMSVPSPDLNVMPGPRLGSTHNSGVTGLGGGVTRLGAGATGLNSGVTGTGLAGGATGLSRAGWGAGGGATGLNRAVRLGWAAFPLLILCPAA